MNVTFLIMFSALVGAIGVIGVAITYVIVRVGDRTEDRRLGQEDTITRLRAEIERLRGENLVLADAYRRSVDDHLAHHVDDAIQIVIGDGDTLTADAAAAGDILLLFRDTVDLTSSEEAAWAAIARENRSESGWLDAGDIPND